jgi:hypothetical protein
LAGITTRAIVGALTGRDSLVAREADVGIPAFALVAAVARIDGNSAWAALLPDEKKP